MVKRNIIHELGLKYCLPDEVIRAIINSPFEFIADRIRNADKKDMRLFYLGRLKMKNRYKNEEGSTDTVIPKKDVAD